MGLERVTKPPAPVRSRQSSPPSRLVAANRLLDLQRDAGNAAVANLVVSGRVTVSRALTVNRAPGPAATPKTAAEIKAMTLGEFNTYAESQADWANEPGSSAPTPMPATDKRKLRELLEWGRSVDAGKKAVLSGCGSMSVADLMGTGMTAEVKKELRRYAGAVAQTEVTVALSATSDIDRARKYGAALAKLEPALGVGVCHAIFDQAGKVDTLGDLIKSGFLDDFVHYVKTCKPVLEAPGKEIVSYIALRKESADPVSFKSQLPNVRNYHRFEKAALLGLVANLKYHKKDKDLFLILHSALDHNGAFHRDENLTQVITDARHLTLMIEGVESLSQVAGQIKPLARAYGKGNKISQAMIAGHGNNNVIQLAGTVDKAALAKGKSVEESEVDRGLTSAPGSTAETDKFMQELVKNMATDPKARIVLNGCLTASNTVNDPLNADPAKAAKQVQSAISAEPSLQTYLQQAAAKSGNPLTVRGANASFGKVGLQDAAGNLDVVPTDSPDPQLTASKLDYIKGGTEPEGAMRAVLEVWAQDRVATPPTNTAIDAVHHRITTEKASDDWDARLIQTLYGIVDKNPANAELIRLLSGAGGDVGEAKHEKECRVEKLGRVPDGQLPTIFGEQAKTAYWSALQYIPLVFNEKWTVLDGGKGADFLTTLGTNFTCQTANPYVDFGAIGPRLGALLPVADAPKASKGQLILALLGVISGPANPVCKTFLRATVGTGTSFPAALGIDGLLDGASTAGEVEEIIGLRGKAAVPVAGSTGNPNNVDLDGDGVNDFYVEPMTRTGAVTAQFLNVRQKPGLAENRLDALPKNVRIFLIGTSGDWFAIEHRGKTGFVFQKFVKLRAVL